MERCPNCSTPARPEAKFCTTCGYRFFEEDGSAIWSGQPSANENVHGWGVSEPAADEIGAQEGWPTAILPEQADANGEDPAAIIATTHESETDARAESDYSGFWPEAAPDPWPTPVTPTVAGGSDQIESSDDQPDENVADWHEPGPSHVSPRARAYALIDQLRSVVEAMQADKSGDLSGVISDLEVAVTPPGALPPDDVAELREALLAARERPRDLDTIVDLTTRVDALVSLVIAYDRAIAAIERSLEALKRMELPAPTESPSPTAVGEGLGGGPLE